jgi:hypothetical protein
MASCKLIQKLFGQLAKVSHSVISESVFELQQLNTNCG